MNSLRIDRSGTLFRHSLPIGTVADIVSGKIRGATLRINNAEARRWRMARLRGKDPSTTTTTEPPCTS